MSESVQKKLSRIRPPRVQITYDVESGGAIEKKELPLIVGILSDLSGTPDGAVTPIKTRKFVEIDRDNFNEVCASIAPRVAFPVPNRLHNDDSKFPVELRFRKIDDFRPESIVQQVEPLRKLMEARQRLNDLIGKLDGNDDLDALLQDVAANTDKQQQIKKATDKQQQTEDAVGGTNG